MESLNTFKRCRLDSDATMGRGLWFAGTHYYIDRNTEFAAKHNLPCIAQVISPNGSTFDIYRGFGISVLGHRAEFACAVYTGTIQ